MASTQARWEGEMASKRPRQLSSRSVKTEMYMNTSVHDKDEAWWLVSHPGGILNRFAQEKTKPERVGLHINYPLVQKEPCACI